MSQSSSRIHAQAGFSLVELAIVLVILGLLTGGVLSGQSLIRSAELRAITNDYSKYSGAVRSFRDKYFALPGDMSNATRFWGTGTCSTAVGAAPGGTTTCNGDGNGFITAIVPTTPLGQEPFRFWQHMALAGIVEGSFSGTSASGTYTGSASPTTAAADLVASTADALQNVPRSRMQGAGWTAIYVGSPPVNPGTAFLSAFFAGTYDNVLLFGLPTSVIAAIGGTTGPVLKPEEAWNIDTKLDDARPAFGIVTTPEAQGSSTGTTGTPVPTAGCSDVATNTTAIETASNYSLQNTGIACTLVFKMGL